MAFLLGIIIGMIWGHSIRIFYFFVTSKDIPLCKPENEIERLQGEIERQRNKQKVTS